MKPILLVGALLEGWLSDKNPSQPFECAERDELAAAVSALAAFHQRVRLTRAQIDRAEALFEVWRQEHNRVPLGQEGSRHLKVIGQVQVVLDRVIDEMCGALAERTLRGKPVDRTKLTAILRVNTTLAAYETVISQATRHAGERLLAAEEAARIGDLQLSYHCRSGPIDFRMRVTGA
jgi:hypothetical protein